MISKILNIVIVVLFLGLTIQYVYKLPKFVKGNTVPDFTAMDIDGKQFNLYSRDTSEYTLINFWGSWCAPCRRKNKDIASLNREFPNEKLNIISLIIERNDKTYENAIFKDSLTDLIHIPQLDYFASEIAKLYGVREIPSSYLINESNKILAVNPTYAEILSLLAEKGTN